MALCTHAAAIEDVREPRDGCETCLEIGGSWVHLRHCLTCGVTLCCDSSPNQHMSRHGAATGHPIVRGISPGEGWVWCNPDDSMIRLEDEGWTTYDPFVDAGVWFARRHLEAGGSADVDGDVMTPEEFPLGTWFAYVRELRAAGTLEPHDATAIEALPGWRW